MRFGAWIRQTRKQKGFSAAQCAERAGMVPSVWSRYETGESRRRDGAPSEPRRETLEQIAKGLNVPFADVLEAIDRLEPCDSAKRMAYKLDGLVSGLSVRQQERVERAVAEHVKTLVELVSDGA